MEEASLGMSHHAEDLLCSELTTCVPPGHSGSL